jgi:receptor expression-enhancing protein 5/6
VLLLVSFDIGGAFFTTLIGFVFPAYCSIVAIESSGKNDDTQWLTYWVFFAGFTVIEKILDLGRHIPFYYLCKLLFFVWCMLPSTKVCAFFRDAVRVACMNVGAPARAVSHMQAQASHQRGI